MIDAVSSATAAPHASQKEATLSSDFDTFLKMLTAQMQNQDPLNPVDAEDFAVQLATFSSVEQQVLTNDLLREMSSKLVGADLMQYSGWIDRDVLTESAVHFESVPVDLVVPGDPLASSAQLEVRTSNGQLVSTQSLTTDGMTLEWAGTDGNGTRLANGDYELTAVYSRSDGSTSNQPVSHYATVTEVRNENGQATLRLRTGQEIAPDAVIGVRATHV
ncbi:flagellar hook capping FlgD N-terminal domain-containing protein [Pseudoprimorskyibacter insulae]|uniref:Basal-body rod modification protein FlgD n=1 Tax=Pseudoprimorskyibacter insulae TaxID=1695997 RepID=A0A2R8AYV4_9RHOB|nr:flagellar hook capping FlgD N-terminal domain-containing protein [Pseudoprimorskyibacter insulae]SPF81202.1 Basal-body rod modification protein FlgD [Pseudoprimorskyibacter insulae]